MSTAIMCDRCGCPTRGGLWIDIGDAIDGYDLCRDCARELVGWIESGKPIHTEELAFSDGCRDPEVTGGWPDECANDALPPENDVRGEQVDASDGKTTAKQWQNQGIDSQPVTRDCERVTKTPELLHDTRAKLEADVREFAQVYYTNHLLVYDKVISLLDRQAAITEREFFESACQGCERIGGEDDATLAEMAQRIQVLELELAKRDKGIERLKKRRGDLTEQLGKMADRMAHDSGRL